ncbi:AraC family transcriptional regulator (plasmid) [Pedobacter sp. BS3]|uniref:AraC family transcriptional regulator n=1 Tax=Pedobacter sp. BS3 TaxID=2567937 RepID=UPI0011F09610|nr:AraC family transcriptional regulator [Pedobacter sp. BS3]TZF86482.1 AraC family transcriptional regulator [Pedobacter sp. BS3]
MKLVLKKLSLPINASFSIWKDKQPCTDEIPHFHPEYEFIHVLKGHGMLLVADKIYPFSEGDLAFLGSNLPHLWRTDPYYKHNDVEVLFTHFSEDFLGKDFFYRPAMAHILQLLRKAEKGLAIKGKTKKLLSDKFSVMIKAQPFSRILFLLDVLHSLALSTELEELSDKSHSSTHIDTILMDKIYTYLSHHFKDDINLDEIAEVAHLSTSAFCKYFKKHTQKTFSEFLNEVKIRHACKLLIETDYSVSQVCYESGFKSLTNFNRQFKTITQLTPHGYRRQHLE